MASKTKDNNKQQVGQDSPLKSKVKGKETRALKVFLNDTNKKTGPFYTLNKVKKLNFFGHTGGTVTTQARGQQKEDPIACFPNELKDEITDFPKVALYLKTEDEEEILARDKAELELAVMSYNEDLNEENQIIVTNINSFK